MLICSKKKYCFKNNEGGRFTTAGNLAFEEAPEWIAKDPFYAEIVAEGNIVECVNSSAAEETKTLAKATAKRKSTAK